MNRAAVSRLKSAVASDAFCVLAEKQLPISPKDCMPAYAPADKAARHPHPARIAISTADFRGDSLNSSLIWKP